MHDLGCARPSSWQRWGRGPRSAPPYLTSDGEKTYVYDGKGRLVEVREGETTLAEMTYDYLDRRTSLATEDGITYFHYAGADVVAETDETGAVVASYTYGPAGILSMTRGGETYCYQRNAHGDVVSLTNAAGTVVNTYTYDPWGRPLSTSETVTNPYGYAGYRYDAATGLYYMWHRYYSPGVRRFLTVDALAGTLMMPSTLNTYVYALDNPLRFVDPTGLAAHVTPYYCHEDAYGNYNIHTGAPASYFNDVNAYAAYWYGYTGGRVQNYYGDQLVSTVYYTGIALGNKAGASIMNGTGNVQPNTRYIELDVGGGALGLPLLGSCASRSGGLRSRLVRRLLGLRVWSMTRTCSSDPSRPQVAIPVLPIASWSRSARLPPTGVGRHREREPDRLCAAGSASRPRRRPWNAPRHPHHVE